jgi:hypothetical protein
VTTLRLHGHWNKIGRDDLKPEAIAALRAHALRWTFWIVLAAGVAAAVWLK